MIILGVNGWFTRSHDSSAAIVRNGRVIAFVEEERFTRYRHAFEQLPHRSIAYCLQAAGLSARDIDILAIGWDYHAKYRLHRKAVPPAGRDLVELYLPKKVFGIFRRPELMVVEHHRAHAGAAFFPINISDAAILVVDGQGEYSPVSFWLGHEKTLTKLRSFSIAISPGYFYEAANRVLGFNFLDSGKTMGLASYGKTRSTFASFQVGGSKVVAKFSNRFRIRESSLDEQLQVIGFWRREFREKGVNVPPPDFFTGTNNAFTQPQKEFARKTQNTLEGLMLWLAKEIKRETGSRTLCLAGGVALNCNANSQVVRSGIFDKIHALPMVNDAGVSLGAALVAEKNRGYRGALHWTPYSGPAYTEREICRSLGSAVVPFVRVKNVVRVAAAMLAKGNIIGWFQGRMEAGPRALGNRSILADPSIRGMNDRVNLIKGRESWRPLAPSILEEFGSRAFEKFFPSPYMLHTFTIRKSFRNKIPAVRHVDNSCRPQSVNRNQNELFWELLREFYSLTRIPMLLNTSFNGPGEPIVCSPDDAIRMFLRTKLDALVIGPYIVQRQKMN